jgi:outer membrane protein W
MALRRVWVLVSLLILGGGLSCSRSAVAKEKSVTNISFGSYQEDDGTDSVRGSQWSIGFTSFWSDRWAYVVGWNNGAASGEHTLSDGTFVAISSQKTTLSGGLQWHYENDRVPALTPYVGVGVAVRQYRYDYQYPGSQTGVTSGTGWGPLFQAGMKIMLARSFIVIPGFQYESVTIETESGSERTVVSSGMLVALVFRF